MSLQRSRPEREGGLAGRAPFSFTNLPHSLSLSLCAGARWPCILFYSFYNVLLSSRSLQLVTASLLNGYKCTSSADQKVNKGAKLNATVATATSRDAAQPKRHTANEKGTRVLVCVCVCFCVEAFVCCSCGHSSADGVQRSGMVS